MYTKLTSCFNSQSVVNHQNYYCLLSLYMVDEMATIVVDFGGRVEALRLMSQSQGTLRDVLLTHNDNATAIMENKFWKGMLLIPWANRIAYVSPLLCVQECVSGIS